MDALIEQCAFYFGDANLRKDKFLRAYAGTKGTSPVPVAILATFNRVKQLTSDDKKKLVDALRAVPGLQVADDGESVSRSRPLPETDDSQLRTVYAESLPAGASIESLHRLFATCGTVAYVSLPRLPSGLPKGFAFIEYDHPKSAVRAVNELMSLRCMHKRAWEHKKAEHKKALAAGKEVAQADADAATAAATTAAATRGRAVKHCTDGFMRAARPGLMFGLAACPSRPNVSVRYKIATRPCSARLYSSRGSRGSPAVAHFAAPVPARRWPARLPRRRSPRSKQTQPSVR